MSTLLTALVVPALALVTSAPVATGQQQAVERGRLRGRVLRVDGTPWAGARVILASTLFPNASGPAIQDTVEVRSDTRGYFTADVLEDRSYAAWAAQLFPRRSDGLRAYRTSQVAAAGVGRAVRLVESTMRAVRVPCTLPPDAPAGSRWIVEGLIHPPAQAEAMLIAFELERDAQGKAWTPLWPSEVVPVRLIAGDGSTLGRTAVHAGLANAQRLPMRDGKVDVALLGRVVVRKQSLPPVATFAVSGKILRKGRPVAGIVVVRDVAEGFRERVVRSDATGAWRCTGVAAPIEVWFRRSIGGLPELSFLGTSSGLADNDLGAVELTRLRYTEVRIKGADGAAAQRAVVAIETFENSLAVLRSFAGRKGRVRIGRRKGVQLALAARWAGGLATGRLPLAASFELVGRESVTLTGRVVDQDGAGLPLALVSYGVNQPIHLRARFRFLLPSRSWTDARGRFRLELPVGEWSYLIATSRFAPGGRIEWSRAALDDARRGEPVELRLGR